MKNHLETKGLRVDKGKTKIRSAAKTYTRSNTPENTLVVCVIKELIVIQSSVMNANLGYTRNVVVLKID